MCEWFIWLRFSDQNAQSGFFLSYCGKIALIFVLTSISILILKFVNSVKFIAYNKWSIFKLISKQIKPLIIIKLEIHAR